MKKCKKGMAVALSFLLCVSLLPATAFAKEPEEVQNICITDYASIEDAECALPELCEAADTEITCDIDVYEEAESDDKAVEASVADSEEETVIEDTDAGENEITDADDAEEKSVIEGADAVENEITDADEAEDKSVIEDADTDQKESESKKNKDTELKDDAEADEELSDGKEPAENNLEEKELIGKEASADETDLSQGDWSDFVPGLPMELFEYSDVRPILGGSQTTTNSAPVIKKASDGKYYYYVNGKVDKSKSGLILLNGKWYYLEAGRWISDEYSFVNYGDGVFLVANGMVATEKNGLVQDPNNITDWYFLSGGQVQNSVSGLVQYDGAWFFVKNGKLDTNYSGFVSYDGGYFFVAKGRLLTETSGLVQNPHDETEWVYLANGQAQTQYVGLVQYDGAWFFVIAGILANRYITYVPYDGDIFFSYYGNISQSEASNEVDEVIAECNYYRMANGALPLIKEDTLCAAAYVRSTELKTQFSHTRPNGQSCFTILDEFGYSCGGGGENIAMGQRTAYQVVNAWMNSSGHRSNILNKNYEYIGVGVYRNGSVYWTQIFSS